ncbi:type IIL restriction-modification enzyme MmeI [Chitinophaga sancti]|uniref:class I SAM-dependent DNA methyltransferase n=1 Tax=Chitinophaga sancti TaxID=1004 RepID=UPI002A752C56|nr:type IIL restriction-modification enzyme MmeI [Chitinophaga sancti]WPQ63417.1 type IIL restriction-modification enzyme MmeI [Chitinophaga sancti]
MIDIYSQIESKLKALRYNTSPLEFILDFLRALQFPQSTIDKLISGYEAAANPQDEHIVNGKYLFKYIPHHHLSETLNNLLTKGKIKTAVTFVFIFNSTNTLVFLKESKDYVITSHAELFKQLELLLPLAGLSAPKVKLINKDVNVAEIAGGLYNALRLCNKNQDDGLQLFLLQLLVMSFVNSFDKEANRSIEKYYKHISSESGEKITQYTFDLLRYVKGEDQSKLPTFIGSIPTIKVDLFDTIKEFTIDKKAAGLIVSLLCIEWNDLSSDTIGSLIYKFVGGSETSGLHYTSTANVNKILNPLLLDDLYLTLSKSKENEDALQALVKRINAIQILDPTNGPGCYLNIAFKELFTFLYNVEIEFEKFSTKSGVTILDSLKNFHGIISNLFGVHLSRFTLSVTYFQYFRDKYSSEEFKTIYNSPHIIHGNPLQWSWEKVCPNEGATYIVGSPVFKGAKKLSDKEKADLKVAFNGSDNISSLDYCSAWLYKASQYIGHTSSKAAFAVTNSLTQGEQVSVLWPKIFDNGCVIDFGYTSFKWKNSISQNTGVTVVIIGLSSAENGATHRLYSGAKVYTTPIIGPYLNIGSVTIIQRRKKCLVTHYPKLSKGNMPYEEGHLLLNKKELMAILQEDPSAKRFIKKIVGSDEFINSIGRWCIWVKDEDLADALQVVPIRRQIDAVRDYRSKSSDKNVQRMAGRPHQFREVLFTTTQSIVVPSVSSENRVYIPMGFIGPDTIVSNLAFIVYDCEPWILGILTSKMHLIWIKTVCGQLETRIRYSSELGYNNFPFPKLSEDKKEKLSKLVFNILRIRECYSEMTLGKMYEEENMPGDLRVVHQELDLFVDKCYSDEPFESETDRITCLFNLYEGIVTK